MTAALVIGIFIMFVLYSVSLYLHNITLLIVSVVGYALMALIFELTNKNSNGN